MVCWIDARALAVTLTIEALELLQVLLHKMHGVGDPCSSTQRSSKPTLYSTAGWAAVHPCKSHSQVEQAKRCSFRVLQSMQGGEWWPYQ